MKNLQASWFQNAVIFIALCITFASVWAIWQLSGTREEIETREQIWKKQIDDLENTIKALKAKSSASLLFDKRNNQNKTFVLIRSSFNKATKKPNKNNTINGLQGENIDTLNKSKIFTLWKGIPSKTEKNETVEYRVLTNLTKSQKKTRTLWIKKIIDMERMLNENKAELKIIKSNLQSIATFQLKPSQAMLEAQRNYKHPFSGISPILPNEWGVYPTINWRTLGGDLNWFNEWNKLKNKRNGILYLPPLIMPNELGGWIVHLYLNWNDAFGLNGGIISQPGYNELAPIKMNVTLTITLLFDDNVPEFSVNKMFTLTKSDWILNHLWKISSFINNTWPIPAINIRVK